MTGTDNVILVTPEDEKIRVMEKMEAHKKGLLHRAFSVFIYNANGDMLIHKRADEKYHCGGLWTNACCSHQRDGESSLQAATRRCQEEMGFTTPLEEIFSFTYKASFSNGLIEHEYDHVLVGEYNGLPKPNPQEVSAWRFISQEELDKAIEKEPQQFTPWFKIAYQKVKEYYTLNKIAV